MKFGLSFLPDAEPSVKSAFDYYQDILKLCVTADRAGLHSVKMTEHYLHPYGGYCPDPLTFLAAVASCTHQIRLMTGCVLPVFHHPIQLASRAALIDAISGGRLDMGFARAYLPYEFDALGVDIDESRDRFVTAINTIKKLWVEENVSLDDPLYKFKNVTILPRPQQIPHPPIWGAAVMSRQSFAWLGEQGHNLLITPPPGPIEHLQERVGIYREAFAANHPASKKPQIAISLPLLIHANHDEAMRLSDEYLTRYLAVWTDATKSWLGRQSSAYPGYAKIPEVLSQLKPAQMRAYKQAIVGTPKEVQEQITWLQQTLQIDQILWQIDFGTQPYSVSAQTLDLFSENILPLYKKNTQMSLVA